MIANYLAPILAKKQAYVTALQAMLRAQPAHPIAQLLAGKKQRQSFKNFKHALRCGFLAVIAEIKRKSPSKGSLAAIADPALLAQAYVTGGACAISVLTDEPFFGGSTQDLINVVDALKEQPTVVLRKDFIVDPVQIAESIVLGADAILCIVAALGENTKLMLDHAKAMGIDAIVEVHDRQELDIAIDAGAEIIGINNRNLSSFAINPKTALQLVENIPAPIIKIAESGILEPTLANEYYQAGFDAVLIGEALVKSENPAAFIRACQLNNGTRWEHTHASCAD